MAFINSFDIVPRILGSCCKRWWEEVLPQIAVNWQKTNSLGLGYIDGKRLMELMGWGTGFDLELGTEYSFVGSIIFVGKHFSRAVERDLGSGDLPAILNEIPNKKYMTQQKMADYHSITLYAQVVTNLALKFNLDTPASPPPPPAAAAAATIMTASAAATIMADDYALLDVPGYCLQDFASSNFKREYEWTATNPLKPVQIDRLLGAVRRVIEGYCTRNSIDQARGDTFFLDLRKEWELTDEVGIAAERLWTSPAELTTAGDGQDPEFCIIFSQLLRDDPASLARSCAIIARALNLNLVAGRTGSAVFPPNGE